MAPNHRSLIHYVLTFLCAPHFVQPDLVVAAGGLLPTSSSPTVNQIDKIDEIKTPHAEPKCFPIEVDVIVVGGGFSGLASAYTLHAAGLSTVVLEARDRIGGRSWSHKLQSGPGIIELGATWINNITQPAVFELTQKFSLDTAEQFTDGDSIFQGPDGRLWRMPPGSPLNTDDPELARLEIQLFTVLNDVVNKTDIRNWEKFSVIQDVTMAKWLGQKGLDHPYIQALVDTLTTALVGRGIHEVGAQYILDYMKSGGSVGDLMGEGKFGAQSLKIKKGTSEIAKGMADTLPAESVRLNTPVESIKQTGNTVWVTTTKGELFNAKKAIIAIPTNTYNDIKFSPPLPLNKHSLVSHTKPGLYAKVILTYTDPWWRKAGLAGKFTSSVGPIGFGWEISDPSVSQYSLALFLAGEDAVRWNRVPNKEKQDAITKHLAVLVGSVLAANARDVLEMNYIEWNTQKFIDGAPTSSMGPGLLRKYGKALREPFDNLHFGGGETAYEWKGYMEGAVTAGQRAAKEVIKALVG